MVLETADVLTIITIVITAGATIFGVYQYRKDRHIRRKDTLLPLTEIFDGDVAEKLQLAKNLLEDFKYYQPNENDELEEYSLKNLDIFIHHNEKADGITDPNKMEIRASFDALLNFFGKLGYLLEMGLIKENEIDYFRDYIEKAANSEAIGKYIENYDFPLYEKLLAKLNLKQKKPMTGRSGSASADRNGE